MRRTTLLIPEWSVGSASKAAPYLGHKHVDWWLHEQNQRIWRTETETETVEDWPVAGLVSAGLVREPRAHEHVFVDPTTQTQEVRCHLVSCLHYGQNGVQSFGPISGMIPPVVGEKLITSGGGGEKKKKSDRKLKLNTGTAPTQDSGRDVITEMNHSDRRSKEIRKKNNSKNRRRRRFDQTFMSIY